MPRKKPDLQAEWKNELIRLVDLFLDHKVPNHDWYKWTPEEKKKQDFRNKLFITLDRFFDNAVRECASRIAQQHWRRKDADQEYLSVINFLYDNPPLGGMPDSSLRIGVDFEVGGAYEDWGFVVEKREYDSENKTYKYRTVATGRGLVEALINSRERLRAEFASQEIEKCECGNQMVGYKQEKDGKRIPQCREHFLNR